MRKFGGLNVGSSVNPNQISATIEAIVKLLGLVIGGFLTVKGSTMVIDDAIIAQTTNAFVSIATAGMAIWQSANLLFGVFRKFTTEG